MAEGNGKGEVLVTTASQLGCGSCQGLQIEIALSILLITPALMCSFPVMCALKKT